MIIDTKVKDVMTRGVITIPEEASVKDAIDIIADNEVSAVVATSEKGELRGILSEIDIIKAYDKDLSHMKVREIMTSPVITVTKEDDLETACQLMKKNNIHRLVVQQDIFYQNTNKVSHFPCGILSISDIIHILASLNTL
ncbi:MAG: CBS domain-containing protein [bacterium]|nr:CBS domain-containing protein [bacterium]